MGDSKKKFDVYFRTLISGVDNDHPKPKSIKITKVSRREKSINVMSLSHAAGAQKTPNGVNPDFSMQLSGSENE